MKHQPTIPARPLACAGAAIVAWQLSIGWSSPALAHPGGHGAVSSGPAAHSGAGIVTLRPDEDLKLSLDFFGYMTGSTASNWRTGEPLGAGGKISAFYNQWLYREGPFERTNLVKKDFWPQYRDFSYNPLWQPSQLGMRTQYRVLPTLQGTVTVVYFGSIDRVTVEANPLEIEELFARWSPAAVPGLAFSFGTLMRVGSYAEPFDQFPLEGFRLNGVAVEYGREVGTAQTRLQLVGGRTPLGRTTQVDLIDPVPARNHQLLDGVRERTHVYVSAAARLAIGLSVGLIGGYQILPEDETTTNDVTLMTRRWPKSSGWHVGAEAGFSRGPTGHHLAVAHGWGDAEMAWGAPDYVFYVEPARMGDGLTRTGSTLLHGVYWGHVVTHRLRLGWGAWGQWRRPAPSQRTWNVFDEVTGTEQAVVAETQDFRALKMNLEPAINLGLVSLGVRLDGIVYLDKDATSNTVEPLTDSALRPLTSDIPGGPAGVRRQGPSRWEREAVDNLIVSPFADLRLGESFRIRASWSGAWYSAPVHRQRQVSTFHANLTLSVWLVHRFGIPNG